MDQPALTGNLSNDMSKPRNTSERAQQMESHVEGRSRSECELECPVVTMLVLSGIKVLLSLRPGMVFEITSNLFFSQSF